MYANVGYTEYTEYRVYRIYRIQSIQNTEIAPLRIRYTSYIYGIFHCDSLNYDNLGQTNKTITRGPMIRNENRFISVERTSKCPHPL